jgi:DNA-binding MarR family transcriptional regulator
MATEESTAQLDATELGAWRGMLRAHRELTARLDAELIAAHGIALGAYEVLLFLGDSPDGRLRMSLLAERLLLSRSGLTRLIDRLESAGFVAREPCEDDGRGWFARITPAGLEKLRTARRTHLDGVRRHFLSQLSRSEQQVLGEVFSRVLED